MKGEKKEKEVIDIDEFDNISEDIDLSENNIINQDNKIFNFHIIQKIMNANLENKICKIIIECNDIKMTGTGFFCHILSKEMKVLITNNHVINQDFLNKERKLVFIIEIEGKENKMEINLDYERFKYTNEVIDFTIIEIIEEDNIQSFFEIDENLFEIDENKNIQIFSMQFPKGENLQISFGNIIKKSIKSKNPENNSSFFAYNIGTEQGSSGSPIISENNLRVIGLHKGSLKHKVNNEKINVGIYLTKVIESIPKKIFQINENVIYCKYDVSNHEVDNEKKLQIFNNKNNIEMYFKTIIVNKNEEEKEKIKNGKYIFNKKGYNFIEYHIDENVYNLDLSYLFSDCNCLKEVSISSLFNIEITNMAHMFENNSLLEKITFSSSFDSPKVEDMSYMFHGCKNLKEVNLESFNTKNVKNMSNMFNNCSSLEKLDITNFNTENVTDMSSMFEFCKFKEIDLKSFDTKNVKNMSKMFNNCSKLKELDLKNFNTEKVEDMSEMFKGCESLIEINLESFNTKNVKKMSGVFGLCCCLKKLDLTNFNTENVKDMSGMFNYCESLEILDISSFNTENVEDFSMMFLGCKNLEKINLQNFSTENVEKMRSMFEGCESLEELDLSSFDVEEKVFLEDMFKDCKKLKLVKTENEFIEKEYKGENPKKLNIISPLGFQNIGSFGYGFPSFNKFNFY